MNILAVHTAVIHCAYTPPEMDIGVLEITEWHQARGFSTVGYHHVVRRSGATEAGRPLNRQGAHVKGHNRDSWGVCLVGGKSRAGDCEDNFTAQQFMSLLSILRVYRGINPRLAIVGHNHFAPDRGCPCFDWAEWLRRVGLFTGTP